MRQWQPGPVVRVPIVIFATLALGATSCSSEKKTVGPDTMPPAVSLLAPVDGAEIPQPRSVLFRARVIDDTGVSHVDFLFDDLVVGSDSTASPGSPDVYEYQWQTSNVALGSHQAKARAFDAAGNSAEAEGTLIITSP